MTLQIRERRGSNAESDRTLMKFQEWNPFRTPNWRWDYAVASAKKHRCPAATHLGCWIVPAYKYARVLESLSVSEARTAQVRKMADMAAAHAIYLTNVRQKWELESRLLTEERIEMVATKTKLPVSVIDCYVAVFFDLLDRLEAHDYISTQVIRNEVSHPISGEEVGRIWKLFAFSGGPVILDAVMDHFAQCGKPDYSYLLREPSITDGPRIHRSIERAIRLMILPMDKPENRLLLTFA